jgi:hypothetical protein
MQVAGIEESDPEVLSKRLQEYIDQGNLKELYRDEAVLRYVASQDSAEIAAIKVELANIRRFKARDFDRAIRAYVPKPERADCQRTGASPYTVEDNSFYMDKEGPWGPQRMKLCNFQAQIAEEITRDDGAETIKQFKIVGTLQGGDSLIAEIPAADFTEMKWVPEKFGARAIMEAGKGVKDNVRAAIQHNSEDIVCRTTYAQTGWREIDGEMKYLSASGAIGADGLDKNVSVDLEGTLANYRLPAPPIGEERRRAVRSTLNMLRLSQQSRPGSKAIASALFSAIGRAPLGNARFSVQATGTTGALKSSTIALAQQHFGAEMHDKKLPGNWADTANCREQLQHAAADAIAVFDDFVPGGSSHEVASAQRDAERLYRSQGNGQARGRLRPDGTPRPSKPPRTLVIATGEDRVRRKSADLRTLPIRFVPEDASKNLRGTIDKELLSECQRDADSGVYAASMAGYVHWLAPSIQTRRKELRKRAVENRKLATHVGDHGRTPEIVGDLFVGADTFLEFAVDVKAITEEEAGHYRKIVWDGLMEAANEVRDDHREDQDAADSYVQLVRAALLSGRYYLADVVTEDAPAGIEEATGWRRKDAREPGEKSWIAGSSSERIGWVDGKFVYLVPLLAYNAVQDVAKREGESFPVMRKTIHKQLFDKKLLAKVDSRTGNAGTTRYACRVTIGKRRESVLAFRRCTFWEDAEHDSEPETVEPQYEEIVI